MQFGESDTKDKGNMKNEELNPALIGIFILGRFSSRPFFSCVFLFYYYNQPRNKFDFFSPFVFILFFLAKSSLYDMNQSGERIIETF